MENKMSKKGDTNIRNLIKSIETEKQQLETDLFNGNIRHQLDTLECLCNTTTMLAILKTSL